jgi:hypothetical protein
MKISSNSTKRLVVVLVMCVFQMMSVVASATNIQEMYDRVGIEPIVRDMLKDGVQVNVIVVDSLTINGLNPQNLVKALYCLGAKSKDIIEASEKNGITDVVLAAGYKKYVAECTGATADSQAYTQTSSDSPFISSVSISPTSGGSCPCCASPSAF